MYEVDPEEDGMVNVRTSDGDEGSIPVTVIGKIISQYYCLTGTLFFRSHGKEEKENLALKYHELFFWK